MYPPVIYIYHKLLLSCTKDIPEKLFGFANSSGSYTWKHFKLISSDIFEKIQQNISAKNSYAKPHDEYL